MSSNRWRMVLVLGCLAGARIVFAADVASKPAEETKRTPVRDGLSLETAIVIGSKSESGGVASEYAWIQKHYPGSKPRDQALLAPEKGHRRYDLITIETADGRRVDLCFDITAIYE